MRAVDNPCVKRIACDMPDRKQLSKTMRIDLIPDVPSQPVGGSTKRIVIARPDARVPVSEVSTEVPQSDMSRYERLLQSVYDATLIVNLAGGIQDVNDRAVEFLQYGRDELRGMTVFDVISGADHRLIAVLCQNLEDERHALIQAHCVRQDGSYFPAEIAVNKIDLDGLHLCFFVRDITLRKQAEEMLLTEHHAIQNSGNGIAVADLDGLLEYVNPALERMWRCADEEALLGQPLSGLFGDPAAVESVIVGVKDNRERWSGEFLARRHDGSTFDVQVSAVCNRNADGEPVGLVLSLVDTSDRKRAEEAERESERRRVMLESLGAACHHLSQPATILLANLEQIQTATKGRIDEPEIQELVQQSLQAMDTLSGVLKKLHCVNDYQTTPYLAEPSEGATGGGPRILKI